MDQRILEGIINEAQINNFEPYRKHYDLMKFDDVKRIAEMLNTGATKTCYHKEVFKALDMVATFDRMRVVELGCGKGQLAIDALACFDISKLATWDGYDMNRNCVPNFIDARYTFHALEGWFYDLEKTELPVYNTFVCSHTFEHMRHWEVKAILTRVLLNAKYIIIEVPLRYHAFDWKGNVSTHVLEIGRKELNTTIQAFGYRCFYEYATDDPKIYSVSGWRRI